MNGLVLFTAHYPYEPGEQFLETEVHYLARSFATVTIVPRVARGIARPVPGNVYVQPLRPRARIRRWLALLAALPALVSSRDIYQEFRERRIVLRRPAVIRRLLGAFMESLRTRDWILAAYRQGSLASEDVIYTYWLDGATFGGVLAKRRIPGLRIVSRAHRHDLYEECHTPPYLPFRSAILTGVDGVHAVSSGGAAYLRNHRPTAASRVYTSRLGVNDPGSVTPPSDDGVFRVVSCSFLVAVKRIDLLIRALALLGNRNPDQAVCWTHIGDGPLAAPLHELAAQQLRGNIAYQFRGHLSNAEVLGLYRRVPVDVFVNVSASEGIPVSIMEAQSFAIPVIATTVGGSPEIVTADNGYLLPSDPSPEEIAQALASFLPGAPGRDRKRTASRETWSNTYDADRNYPKFCAGLIARTTIGDAPS